MKRKLLIIVSILALILVTRLPGINSGLNVLEPDEWDYQSIAQSLNHKDWPEWHNKIYLDKHFSFIYGAYEIGRIFPITIEAGPYINIRLISVLADILFCICLLNIFRQLRLSTPTAIFSLLIVIFIPIHWFFARMGTYEMLFVAFGTLFLTSFFSWIKKRDRKSLIATSVTFALSMTAKHINVLLGIVFVFPFIKALLSIKAGGKNNYFPFIKLATVFIVAAILYLILLTPMILKSPTEFLKHYFGTYGQFFIFNPKTFLAISWEYLKVSPTWLGLPVMTLVVIGIWGAIRRKDSLGLSLVLGLVVSFAYLCCYFINDRSFMIVFIWISIMAGIGLGEIAKRTSKIKFYLIAVLMMVGTFIPGWTAYQSTLHTAREVALQTLVEVAESYPSLRVYTTLDYQKTAESTPGVQISLLDNTATGSAIVLTDKLQSTNMLNLSEKPFVEAREVRKYIEQNYQPVYKLVDPLPHFPWDLGGNEYQIFVID